MTTRQGQESSAVEGVTKKELEQVENTNNVVNIEKNTEEPLFLSKISLSSIIHSSPPRPTTPTTRSDGHSPIRGLHSMPKEPLATWSLTQQANHLLSSSLTLSSSQSLSSPSKAAVNMSPADQLPDRTLGSSQLSPCSSNPARRSMARKSTLSTPLAKVPIVELPSPGPANTNDCMTESPNPKMDDLAKELKTAEQSALQRAHEVVNALVECTGKPRTIVIYALYSHSGDIKRAYQYLVDEHRQPEWTFRQDHALLSRDSCKIKELTIDDRSEDQMKERFLFLLKVCELPIASDG